MNQEVKEKWVAALRSGEYEQGRGYLNRGEQFCCLGVLCEVAITAGVDLPKARLDNGTTKYGGNHTVLPSAVRDWSDLPSLLGDMVSISGKLEKLAGHNDDGRSFVQIADAIETQL